MTRWITALAALMTTTALAPLPAWAGERCATLRIDGIRPAQGALLVAAYASEATFLRQPAATAAAPAGPATQQDVSVCGLPAEGPIAFVLFQDLDGNQRMGRNAMGMPTEPWGASGSPAPFGPNWGSAAVILTEAPQSVALSS